FSQRQMKKSKIKIIKTMNAQEMRTEDFEEYLKSKSTEFLNGLQETGLNALGTERHQQVKKELDLRLYGATAFN
ncbi:MAG: hypothetical protein AABY22_10910, partial [Nanoarchaeota archaeon]